MLQMKTVFHCSFIYSISKDYRILILMVYFRQNIFCQKLKLFFNILLISGHHTEINLSFFNICINIFRRHYKLSGIDQIFRRIFHSLYKTTENKPEIFNSHLLFFIQHIHRLFRSNIKIDKKSAIHPLYPTLQKRGNHISRKHPYLIGICIDLILTIDNEIIMIHIPLIFCPHTILFPHFSQYRLRRPQSADMFHRIYHCGFPFCPQMPAQIAIRRDRVQVIGYLHFFSHICLGT